MPILLGCIADDFTGATDLANTLVREGMRTVQWIGVPEGVADVPEVDAVVVALKSRTIEPENAVAQSVRALRALQAAGARQIYFKYCSTFDSTPRGNIGPVLEALLDELNADFTVACPAFPENGRTVYQGHLFVDGALLSESGMRNHPLTPMTDAHLVRVLGAQMSGRVGLIPFPVVEAGTRDIEIAMERLRSEGVRCAIVDALTKHHLHAIGKACRNLELVTGGSGVAAGLPRNFGPAAIHATAAATLPANKGPAVVLAGSCSEATRAQIEKSKAVYPSFFVDPVALHHGEDVSAQAVRWAVDALHREAVVIYSSMPPEDLAQIQASFGRDETGDLIERTFAQIATGLAAEGIRTFVVAGGETSGAVVSALGVRALRIGPEIAPGVPWTLGLYDDEPLFLALKSGNFGSVDFFAKAIETLK